MRMRILEEGERERGEEVRRKRGVDWVLYKQQQGQKWWYLLLLVFRLREVVYT